VCPVVTVRWIPACAGMTVALRGNDGRTARE
jgi:hypothetical protein